MERTREVDVNPYEELAGYRFASGRDYDKRAVETFRARVLNLVDDLLNQVTQLQDEVADLRDRCRVAAIEAAPQAPALPVVPTSWLAAVADAPDEAVAAHLTGAPASYEALPAAAFPAPALGNWLAELETPPPAPIDADDGLDDEDEDDDDIGAGSTAELLLAAAGNAVAAAAMATRNGSEIPPAPAPAPTFEHVPPAARPPLFVPELPDEPAPDAPDADAAVWGIAVGAPSTIAFEPTRGFEPMAAFVVRGLDAAPEAASPIELEPFAPGDPATRRLVVTPTDAVVAEPPPISELSRLPIVLDDGLPDDEPLPTPIRHWGGWMRDGAPLP